RRKEPHESRSLHQGGDGQDLRSADARTVARPAWSRARGPLLAWWSIPSRGTTMESTLPSARSVRIRSYARRALSVIVAATAIGILVHASQDPPEVRAHAQP